MNEAKIRLSPKERELVTNAEWILTKNAIIHKVIQFFSLLQQEQKAHLHAHRVLLPENMLHSSPKISKGENYKGLPYVVLDYPRIFNSSGFGAIRTMFWWGNFFSVTLHIAGKNKKNYEDKVVSAYERLRENDFFVCINSKEWEHDFSEGNYTPLQQISKEGFIASVSGKEFLKISAYLPLNKFEIAASFMLDKFKLLSEVLVN
jgi:hypothetical protein